ncbi:hypothetical protein C1645_835231 [Glomus cerebriforme]|uniref:Uncharacterized protein n=1 Tax=Glomus cerebriforme TaxID=658196 RepID=A0A397SI97_9GLOM|nr:hypothetical protein C1645_835231 [Glomus cerebriforme]
MKLFQTAVNLECIGIHTYGSICDDTGKNRSHIKSFNWWASSWPLKDIVKVNIEKNGFERAVIMVINPDHNKFTVCVLDPSFFIVTQVLEFNIYLPQLGTFDLSFSFMLKLHLDIALAATLFTLRN